MSGSLTPEMVVQRQLDAYNAHDLRALLAIYDENAQLFEHPSTLLASGTDALRERYEARFKELNPHAKLVNRVVMGNTVIDHETVTRTFSEGPGILEMIMIYEVQDERIIRAWSIIGEKTLDR